MLGVSVTRGRLPGSTTLKGLSVSSSTKLCMRWLKPMPVSPATKAGIQPPEGVTDTTQPSASAAWMAVVPAIKLSSMLSVPACWKPSSPSPSAGGGTGCHWLRSASKGFFSPWYG